MSEIEDKIASARAVIADIRDQDVSDLLWAGLVLMFRSPDPKEKADGRALTTMIRKGKIR